ncbi:MAG: ChbG/HpnK family deacetylase, partial [Candidatus Omnitrophica bacterium]|nr:ChbG/HpnK family deacetylase [Candidatus Omnitrophota bacterium]
MLAKKKFLIINADDFNLTAGISRAICAAVDTGVVTSTSVFINEKATPYLKKVKAYHSLGIGLHFNITSGSPLSKPQDVKTLVTRRGTFLAKEKNCFNQTASADIFKELNSQFKKFCAFFGRMPTHIDSHHHVHYNKTVYNVIIQLAKQYRIPIRRRCRDGKACRSEGVLTTDYMYA